MKTIDGKRIQTTALVVRKSGLPGAGKGLFAKDGFIQGQLIIEYKGARTTMKEVRDSGIISHYIYCVNRNYVIDANDYPESLGRYANDADGLSTYNGITNNAKFILLNKKVYLQAVRNIAPGAEILVAYGKAYWDTIRTNIEIDKINAVARKKKNIRKV